MQSDPQTGTRCALWWCLRESELPHPHGAHTLQGGCLSWPRQKGASKVNRSVISVEKK